LSLIEAGRHTSSRFFAALAYRDYRTMWVATMSAGGAAWALIVARGTLVFTMSSSSSWVGLVTFAAMIPMFFVPPMAGLFADRWDRKKMLAWIFGFQVITNALLAALVLSGEVELWHIAVLSLVNGIIRAGQMPAAQALGPNLVPRDKLENAVALNAATQNTSRLLGPMLIAPLLATVGAGWAFVLCTVLYSIALVMITRIRTVSTGVVDTQRGAVENLMAGLNFMYGHTLLRQLVILMVLHCALVMAVESMIPVLSQERLGGAEASFAYFMMAEGGGAMITVVGIAGVQSEKNRGRLLLWMGLVSGLGNLGLAASRNMTIALIAAAVMGGAQGGFMTLTAVIIQSIVPDSIRGRVSSIYLLHIGGMMAIFNLVNGNLADVYGAPTVLAVTSTAFIGVLAMSLGLTPLRALYFTGSRTALGPQAA
jgi:MFS family permease